MARPKKPTIEELERMMDDPTKGKIYLKPDGGIETIKPETEADELVRLRRENSALVVDLSEARGVLCRIKAAVNEITDQG